MQNSKIGQNINGFMRTASHNNFTKTNSYSHSKPHLMTTETRHMRIGHFKERLRTWHVFNRILDRVRSIKVIAGFGLRMYTTLIPPYIFSSADEELFLTCWHFP